MGHSLWTTPNRGRYFLVADDQTPVPGDVTIVRLDGTTVSASSAWLGACEITGDQARRIASTALGETLATLKVGVDDRLSSLRDALAGQTHSPGHALLDLVRQLPGVVLGSLAEDVDRVASAKATMARLQQRLQDAGIDVDDRLTDFPGRLAALRAEALKQNN